MKIRVIVPVYNASRYIERCFDSVLQQSFTEWEVVAVDDGSTDNSLDLMRNYNRRDSRFNIYHQENAGAGAARNYALEISKKKNDDGYIVFIDSDDYIEPEYFKLLSEHDEDVVFIDNYQKDETGKVIREERMSSYASYDGDTILRKQMTGCIPWGGWRKAYKAHLLLNHDILYSTHKVGEEAIFSFKALYYARSVGFINSKVYSYVLHEGSLSSIVLEDPWGEVAQNLQNTITELGEYERYANTLNAFHVSAAAISLRRLAKKYGYRQYCEKARDRIGIMNDRINLSYGVDNNSLRSAAKVMRRLMNIKAVFITYVLGRVY